MPVGIDLSLSLPRDVATVPLVRHLCADALREIGVAEHCVADVELAVTEACANVVRHADDDDDYEVQVTIRPERVEIRVVDTGRGFDFTTLGAPVQATAESGRGVQLMRALVDSIDFDSEPESGTVVKLTKSLHYAGASAFAAMADGTEAAPGG